MYIKGKYAFIQLDAITSDQKQWSVEYVAYIHDLTRKEFDSLPGTEREVKDYESGRVLWSKQVNTHIVVVTDEPPILNPVKAVNGSELR